MNVSLRSLERRITALEAQNRDVPLMVLAESPTGTTATMTAKEMIRRHWGFCRVVGGDNLEDLMLILDRFRSVAEQAVNDEQIQIIDETDRKAGSR